MNHEECVVIMSDGLPCRRKAFAHEIIGYRLVDANLSNFGTERPVCILHSSSPEKLKAGTHAVFASEIVNIVEGHGWRESDTHDFRGIVFCNFTNFGSGSFVKPVIFTDCEFKEEVSFAGTRFKREARFNLATFAKDVNFWDAKFDGDVDLSASSFKSRTLFTKATFSRRLMCEATDFEWVDFRLAEFNGYTRFYDTTFRGRVDFSNSCFKGARTLADFTFAKFEKQEEVLFHRVNKTISNGFHLRVLNCDVERVSFRDVRWNMKGGRVVIEDELDLSGSSATEITDTRNELVAVVYRQLLKNFEATRSYDLAEDCFRGEMLMKQKDPGQASFNRVVLWMYGMMSHYGSSYRRAFAWVVVLIVLFGLLFPLAGLRVNESSTNSGPSPAVSAVFQWPRPKSKVALVKTAAAGLWASLAVASFQKSPAYEPGTPVGKHLATLESILVSSQFALFLLALRRRFKRD